MTYSGLVVIGPSAPTQINDWTIHLDSAAEICDQMNADWCDINTSTAGDGVSKWDSIRLIKDRGAGSVCDF